MEGFLGLFVLQRKADFSEIGRDEFRVKDHGEGYPRI